MHVDIEDVPGDLVAMEIEVPDDSPSETVDDADLSADWNRVEDHPACLAIGRRWARAGGHLVLRVPSAVIPAEANYLLNPRHPEAGRVIVAAARDFAFDPRLLQ